MEFEPAVVDKTALVGRELPSGVNSPELLAEHYKATRGMVRTRFPPEPNGYLHVGHAKSMNMNFQLSFEKLGVPPERRYTIFRFDDTNPEAESHEYIESLKRDVAWMGWKPAMTTYTSDYFDELYTLAVKLINKGLAYVCHQSKAEIEASRDIIKRRLLDPNNEELQKLSPNSPWRDRPITESLREFENMRKGKYDASEATLRLKMDMTSSNPNMWDQVAYRIKYMPHPHTGDKWCIYPTYDYTHCIIDSLEHIDYSICTLEFETRRESYYWVLEALDMYRPKVYEMSRLNLTNTVLSKRRLLKLVNSGYMRSWSDPRMPTIQGLRRRGYNPSILNAFCMEIGVTRNMNVVQYERLAAHARNVLHEVAPRVMGVVNPLKVVITGLADAAAIAGKSHIQVPHFPFDASRGSHPVPLPVANAKGETEIYIDQSDFRVVDDSNFFGLSINKVVGLRYYQRIMCDSAECDSTGTPQVLRCHFVPDSDETKPKVYIQWVGVSDAIPVELRLYNNLFTVEEPTEDWEAQLNPASEVVKSTYVDSSIFLWNPVNETPFQLERVGFVTIDEDTRLPVGYADRRRPETGSNAGEVSVTDADAARAMWLNKPYKLVMNLTVGLNSSKPKGASDAANADEGLSAPNRSRKAEALALAAEKERLKSIPPADLFKHAPYEGMFKEYDADGVPTVSADGEPVSKSMSKKLRKDWEKHKKFYESANKE